MVPIYVIVHILDFLYGLQKVLFKNKEHEVFNLETFDFSKTKITFFAAGGKISEKYAPLAAKHSVVIDNSSFIEWIKMCP